MKQIKTFRKTFVITVLALLSSLGYSQSHNNIQTFNNQQYVQSNGDWALYISETNRFYNVINPSENEINISTYPTGVYSVLLKCDGIITDNKGLVIN